MPRTETEPGRPLDAQPDPGPLEPVAEVVQAVKPRLRGWLHAGAAPLALVAGIVLVSLAPTALGRLGGAVFLAASVLLFGTSGLYHRGTWSRPWDGILRRLDHANIYVFIAATYTPLALLLLTGAFPRPAAHRDLGRRTRRNDLPAVLAVGPALALHRAVPDDGLGRGGLAGRVPGRGRTRRC